MHFGQENYVIPPMLDSFLSILESVHICNYLQILNLNENIFHIFNFVSQGKVPIRPLSPFPPLYCEILVPTLNELIVTFF